MKIRLGAVCLCLAVLACVLEASVTEKISASHAATLTPPSDASGSARFGSSVAASPSTVVVGARGIPAAYVYERNQGGTNRWGQRRKLVPTDPSDNHFGFSVAVSGNTIAVGDDLGGRHGEGAVYIFERNRGGEGRWGQTKRIPAPQVSFLGGFGDTVALSGDTLVVGTSILDSAYVLSRNKGGANNWGVVKKLTGPRDSFFGTSVAVSGDLALVGSHKNIAYLYGRNQGGSDAWGLLKAFIPPPFDGGGFGLSVAISGTTVALGAPRSFGPVPGTQAAGAVFVYDRNQGGPAAWGLVKKISSPDFHPSRYFGTSVAVSGDVILAGSPPEFQNGSACFFSRNAGGTNLWGAVALWRGTDNGSFGSDVAVGGDTAVVGQNGAAFVFRLIP